MTMRFPVVVVLLCSCVGPSDKSADTETAETGPAPEDSSDTGSHVDTAEETGDTAPPPSDADGDGFDRFSDCDDHDVTAYPGAPEACDGADDDCDGATDEGDSYPDADGDGHGDASSSGTVCADGIGVRVADDCDDADPFVYPGAPDGCGWTDANCDGNLACDLEAEALVTFVESDIGAHQDGKSASLGDLDGDGVADVLLGGAGGEFDDGDPLLGEGQVHVVLSGPRGAGAVLSLNADAEWTLRGDADDQAAGAEGSANGATVLRDLDGDGFGELLVGASGRDGAWLLSGRTLLAAPSVARLSDVADQELLENDLAVGNTGQSVSEAGDMDGDGVVDLAIGAYQAVWILDYDLTSAARSLEGGIRIEGVSSLASTHSNVGDVDGDGFDDFVIGNYADESVGRISGAAFLFLGGTLGSGTTVSGDEADSRVQGAVGSGFGTAIGASGDLDGDGLDDWMVSDQSEGGWRTEGAVYLIHDSAGRIGSAWNAADISARIEGVSAGSLSAGDFDGDGRPDIAIKGAFSSPRAAYVVPNRALPTAGTVQVGDEALTIASDDPDVYLAGLVCMNGDATGDGLADLLMTDASYPGLDYDGGAWLIPGR